MVVKYNIDEWDAPYNHMIKEKKAYELAIKNYKARIRLFFKQYEKIGFNGVINTCEINLDYFNNPCIVKLGYQELPRQAIIDFCEQFNFYMPTIEFIEHKDYEWGTIFTLKAYYTFRKKEHRRS